MFGLGPQELFIILIIALIIFGPKRIPEIARSIGNALGNLNKASKSFANEVKTAAEENEEKEAKKAKV